MSQFVVLAYNPKAPPQISPEQAQEVVRRFYEWTNNLKQRGQFVASARLAPTEGRVLRAQGDDLLVTDGPYPESKEILGGYWIIEAASYDDALTIVGNHPHLAFGGTLELRQIMPT